MREWLGCSSDATLAPPENGIAGKPEPVTHEFVSNLGPNGKAGFHKFPKKPKRRSTLPPPPKLDLLDGEKLGCNGKTSTVPAAMGAPPSLPLSGLWLHFIGRRVRGFYPLIFGFCVLPVCTWVSVYYPFRKPIYVFFSQSTVFEMQYLI